MKFADALFLPLCTLSAIYYLVDVGLDMKLAHIVFSFEEEQAVKAGILLCVFILIPWLSLIIVATIAWYRCRGRCTVGQNNQEYRLKYWATRSSVRSFTHTTHLFACSALLALLAHTAALTCLLTHSLHSLAHFAHSLARGTVSD